MSLQSKFPGKCKACLLKFQQGDLIFKAETGVSWCSSIKCQGVPKTQPAATQPAATQPAATQPTQPAAQQLQQMQQPQQTPTSIPGYAQAHIEIMQFAKLQAQQYFQSMGRTNTSETSLDILTQVFYKKCMDYQIHGAKN